MMLVGLCSRIATTGISAIQAMPGAIKRDTSLGVLYPSVSTWWVPESLFGYFAWVLTAVLGLTLVQMAKATDRGIG